jgi:hypothetical protein
MSVNLESIWGNMPFVQYPEREGQFRLPIPGNPTKTYIAGSTKEQALENLQSIDAHAVIVMTGKGSQPNEYLDFRGKRTRVLPEWVEYISAGGIPVLGCHYVKTWSKTEFISAAARNTKLKVQGLIWDVEEAENVKHSITNAPKAIKSTRDAYPDLTMGITTWSGYFNEKGRQIHNLALAQAILGMTEIEVDIPMVCPKNILKVSPTQNKRDDVVDMFNSRLNTSLTQRLSYLPRKPLWIWYPVYTGEGTSVFGPDVSPMVGLVAQSMANFPDLFIRGVSPWNADHANRYEESFGCFTAMKQIDYSVFRGNSLPPPSNN